MSVIRNQTIKGSIYSYLGVLIGVVYTIALRPHCLDSTQNGVLELIVSFSAILVQLSSMGFQSAGVRFFPYFKNEEKQHNGFLSLSIIISSIGFILCFFGITYFGDLFSLDEGSYKVLFGKYTFELWIITFCSLFFGVFDNYNRLLFDSVTGTVLKEFYQKFFVFLAILSLWAFSLDFRFFLDLWILANCLPLIFIIIKTVKQKIFFLKVDFSFLSKRKPLIKGMLGVSTFAIMSGFTTMVIQYIDKIMIGNMLGLSYTGIYGITVYFAIVISLPSRIMYKIAAAVIAEKWKEKNMKAILTIYQESCLSQLMIGLLLFIGIWANIDNLLLMLPKEYAAGKYVILFMSLGALFEMSTGVNGLILSISKLYRYDTYFFFALVGFVILLNYLLIPLYGINGAAIASSLSVCLFNIFRFIFVWIKFDLQPLSWKNLFVVATGCLVLWLSYFIPPFSVWILDIIIRSIFIGSLYLFIIVRFNISSEMNKMLLSFIKLKPRSK